MDLDPHRMQIKISRHDHTVMLLLTLKKYFLISLKAYWNLNRLKNEAYLAILEIKDFEIDLLLILLKIVHMILKCHYVYLL